MAGWTTPRTFVAGEVETAAIFNAHLRDNLNAINGYVQKTADQSVTSSTVLVNDTHLLYAIPAAGTYVFDLKLYAQSVANAAGDINLSVAFPTGTCHWGAHSMDLSLASGTAGTFSSAANLSATSGVTIYGGGLSTSTNLILLHGVLIATASGTLRLMWAQNSSNVSASTVKSGSHMLVRQVA